MAFYLSVHTLALSLSTSRTTIQDYGGGLNGYAKLPKLLQRFIRKASFTATSLPTTFLLDVELDIKLGDFQGRLLAQDEKVQEYGLSVENTKSFMPQDDSNYADLKTEIFALGSYIMEGQEPYPDLDPDYEEEQIVERFKTGQFPNIKYSSMSHILHKCWAGEYDSVCEVLGDLEVVRKGLMAEGVEEKVYN